MPVSRLPSQIAPHVAGDGIAERLVRHLNQIELSRRWKISPRTLERWRWLKIGPDHLKIGGRVVYRLEDIETFEAARLHQMRPVPGKGA